MNKLLLRIAAGLPLAAVCVSARCGTTIYGVVDAAVVHVSDQNGASSTYLRSGNQLASRLGVKGTEDLGGGMCALYVLEAGVNLDTGAAPQAGSFFNRQSYVGLESERLGTVAIGRQYPTYYLFVGLLVRAGAPTGSTDAHPGDIDGLDAASRISNAVSYTSPVWRGLQFGAVAGTGEQARGKARGNASSAAVRYDGGPWQVALGYQALENGADGANWDPTAAGSLSHSALNAGYLSAATVRSVALAARRTAGRLSVSGAVSQVRYRPGAASRFLDTASFNTAGATVTWQTATPWLLGASVSHTRENRANGIAAPADYRQLALEQIYALSKRTSIYLVQARQVARGTTLGANGAAVAAVAVIGDAQVGGPSSNGRQNVFMAGLRHDF